MFYSNMKYFLLLFSILIFASCNSSSTPHDVQLGFHTQTPVGESKNAVFAYTYKGKVVNMRRIPDITLRDMESHKPFLSKNRSYGTILTLNREGANRLYNHTVTKQGQLMISILNGVVSEPFRVDKPISDRRLVIWDSLTQKEINHLDYSLPRTGDTPEQAEARSEAAKEALRQYKSDKPESE